MNIEFKIHYRLEISNCKAETINKIFTQLLPLILSELYKVIILAFGEAEMLKPIKDFGCKCGNHSQLIWKTRHGRPTNLSTVWGDIKINQLQVKCKKCDSKFNITRKLLGMGTRQILSKEVENKLALTGALSSYRVSETISKMFGSSVSRSTIWRCVQKVGEKIVFDLDLNGEASGQADGTGIPIQGIKKRGKELKVFAQETKQSLRIAGLGIGKYESGWDEVFSPLKDQFEEFGEFALKIDGDCAILKGFNADIKITVQRCLWHIPHQIKHYLWKDGVKFKSAVWLKVMCWIIRIVSLPKEVIEDDELIMEILNQKEHELDEILAYLKDQNCKHCLTHISNARDEMFTNLKNKLQGKTTSLIERLMRTVNLRINVGKWGAKGALNVLKVRLAYYYNNFYAEEIAPFEQKTNEIIIEQIKE